MALTRATALFRDVSEVTTLFRYAPKVNAKA
jgi:hypothetical protein